MLLLQNTMKGKSSCTMFMLIQSRNYFATSHLMAKLLAVGHASDEGVYDYSGVKRWFKNVNIFEMDKIFVPIHHGRMHWMCTVICMTEKKICMYDSMGGHGMEYLEALLAFINDEHMTKKGVSLRDIGEWELVGHKLAHNPAVPGILEEVGFSK